MFEETNINCKIMRKYLIYYYTEKNDECHIQITPSDIKSFIKKNILA